VEASSDWIDVSWYTNINDKIEYCQIIFETTLGDPNRNCMFGTSEEEDDYVYHVFRISDLKTCEKYSFVFYSTLFGFDSSDENDYYYSDALEADTLPDSRSIELL